MIKSAFLNFVEPCRPRIGHVLKGGWPAQADFTVGGEATPVEVAKVAAIIDRRLRHLGAEQISVGVDGHRLQVEAWWEEDIPWAQLARKGLLRIGADHELSLTNEHLENAVADRRPMTSSYGVLLELTGRAPSCSQS